MAPGYSLQTSNQRQFASANQTQSPFSAFNGAFNVGGGSASGGGGGASAAMSNVPVWVWIAAAAAVGFYFLKHRRKG